MQLGGDLIPEQNAENGSARIDHVYSFGERLRPLATTLVFTNPFDGVWMSDHYGLLSTFAVSDEQPTHVPNPARDHDGSILPTHVLDVTQAMFYCDGPSIGHTCGSVLKPFYVVGPKGLTLHNVPGAGLLDVRMIRGSGPAFATQHATLDSDERVSFVFSKDGDYTFRITDSFKNVVEGTVHAVSQQFSDGAPPVVPWPNGE
jgi:hypothetical protein